ncbi:hypothetical protein ACFL4L_01405 [bacterium]
MQSILNKIQQKWIHAVILLIISLLIFACHEGHGLSPTGEDAAASSGISGTITFVGDWPDSTLTVNVIVSKTYPQGMTDPDSLNNFVVGEYLTGNILLGDTIPKFVMQYDYTFNLKPDEYEWILVAWFPDIENYLYGVKELGAYYMDSEEIPEPVYIPPGEIVENINMIADFSNVHNEIPFFKK